LHPQLAEGKPVAFGSQLGVLGCTADISPSVAINGGLESDAVEFPVTQENDVRPLRHDLVDLLQQLYMGLFWEMPLASLHHDPANGQSPFLVDHIDHQGQALPSHFTAIHNQG